ncbi:MAG TPA: VOC family protein [Gaiellaceae bacterium]|nr:VOC family protein [Gaiellaceae bacterium]
MFDHVTIRVSDREASERFYESVLAAIGIGKTHSDEQFAEWDDFSLAQGEPTRRLHVGFVAPTRAQVDAFWEAGIAAGRRSDGEPGPRPQYRHDYYGSFLLDPDGSSVEAVHHGALRAGGSIDHLWIRVGDLAASKAFYELVAPHAGFELRRELPGRVQFSGGNGSFSVVAGTPTERLHVAFPAADDAAVDAFHRAAAAAGYRDNGPPGERRHYHPGYYAAFVLDPDGSNVELVSHNR